MSEIPSRSDAESLRPSSRALAGWLREPLLHFLALGALLFGLDHYFAGGAEGARNRIVLGPEAQNQIVETFRQARGRAPDDGELKALYRIWLDNEVLYREGLTQQLDQGDPAIRERVIFKMLSVVDAGVKLPDVDDAKLKAWFEAHREKYDEPARYDFQEAALAGPTGEASVRDFVRALNQGMPGDAKAGLRIYKARPESNLLQSFGAEFSKDLQAVPVGEWRAMQTREGWRAIRLDAIRPAQLADFVSVYNVVLQDWKDALASEQRSAAVRKISERYRIELPAGVQP